MLKLFSELPKFLITVWINEPVMTNEHCSLLLLFETNKFPVFYENFGYGDDINDDLISSVCFYISNLFYYHTKTKIKIRISLLTDGWYKNIETVINEQGNILCISHKFFAGAENYFYWITQFTTKLLLSESQFNQLCTLLSTLSK